MTNRNVVTAGAFVLVLGFQVFPAATGAEVEFEKSFNLARGELVVKNSVGELLCEKARGFLPISRKKYLLRKEDGSWSLYSLKNGEELSGLCQVNIKHGKDVCVMFDDEGRIRPNQQCYKYKTRMV